MKKPQTATGAGFFLPDISMDFLTLPPKQRWFRLFWLKPEVRDGR